MFTANIIQVKSGFEKIDRLKITIKRKLDSGSEVLLYIDKNASVCVHLVTSLVYINYIDADVRSYLEENYANIAYSMDVHSSVLNFCQNIDRKLSHSTLNLLLGFLFEKYGSVIRYGNLFDFEDLDIEKFTAICLDFIKGEESV